MKFRKRRGSGEGWRSRSEHRIFEIGYGKDDQSVQGGGDSIDCEKGEGNEVEHYRMVTALKSFNIFKTL